MYFVLTRTRPVALGFESERHAPAQAATTQPVDTRPRHLLCEGRVATPNEGRVQCPRDGWQGFYEERRRASTPHGTAAASHPS